MSVVVDSRLATGSSCKQLLVGMESVESNISHQMQAKMQANLSMTCGEVCNTGNLNCSVSEHEEPFSHPGEDHRVLHHA